MTEEQKLKMKIAGLCGLLCECSVYVTEDERESIAYALEDNGFQYRRILDRLEIILPDLEGA